MAKRKKTEDILQEITVLTDTEAPEIIVPDLQKYMAHKNSVVVARAAKAAGKLGLDILIPDLVQAFNRFMDTPIKTDSGCLAKLAIIEVLDRLGHRDPDVYLLGIRHIQMEPVYGGRKDSADNLRGKSAHGLVKTIYSEIHFELAALLMDPEPQPRRAAIDALSYLGTERAELMLRLKVLAGDEEPDITGRCFSALVSISPDRSPAFVASYLDHTHPGLVEEAALALGNSRKPAAMEILKKAREGTIDTDRKKMFLLPMALTRLDAAFEYLLDVLADEAEVYALTALEALEQFHSNPHRKQQVQKIVIERNSSAVNRKFRESSQ